MEYFAILNSKYLDRIIENINVFHFKLNEDDMHRISLLDKGYTKSESIICKNGLPKKFMINTSIEINLLYKKNFYIEQDIVKLYKE